MLKRFSDFAPIHFYKNLQGNIELSVLKEMPNDKLYIYCGLLDGEKEDKELIACVDNKRLIEYTGFTLDEAESIVDAAYPYRGRMRWFATHAYFRREEPQMTESLIEQLTVRFNETYIPSPDVRAYLFEIGHQFSDFEKAVIIANHALLSNTQKKRDLKKLYEITEDENVRARIEKELSHLQNDRRYRDDYFAEFKKDGLFEKIFIPHDFRNGDIVISMEDEPKPDGTVMLGAILGYSGEQYEFYKNMRGDYSDVQIAVDMPFTYEKGATRAYDYLGGFSHVHVNPIYIKRLCLPHDDERRGYIEYLAEKYSENNIWETKGRHPQRINAILRTIKSVWRQNSDLCLGQLLSVAADKDDVFSIEDDDLMDGIWRHFIREDGV